LSETWRSNPAGRLVRRVDDAVMDGVDQLASARSRVGATVVRALDRGGSLAQQPPAWAAAAAVLAGTGPRGRRAAARGAVCYAATGLVANVLVKPLVGRRRPPPARHKLFGPATSSFPSGHSATDVAFVFGAAQEVPAAFLPLGVLALAAHWSLVRSRGHYPSDIVAGGLIGLGVALAARRIWPPAVATAARAIADESAGAAGSG
jgi:undecaprenyl-diphosphatase